jgi:hypothetical protein
MRERGDGRLAPVQPGDAALAPDALAYDVQFQPQPV